MITLLYLLKTTLLILLLATPFIAYAIKHKYCLRWRWVFLMASVVAYGLIIGTAWATDAYFNAILQTYDLDNNGFFQGDEITAEQQQAMHNVISDTGRAFAPITGLVFAPIGVALCFGLCGLMRASWRWIGER